MGWEKTLGVWFVVGRAVSFGGATTRKVDYSTMVEDSADPSPPQPRKIKVKNTKKTVDNSPVTEEKKITMKKRGRKKKKTGKRRRKQKEIMFYVSIVSCKSKCC